MMTLAIGGIILVLSTIAQAINPKKFNFLPLGGSPISEMGIVLGFCFVVIMAGDLVSKS